MPSRLLSLLLLGLPIGEGSREQPERLYRALQTANLHAFLGQHAMLYCLLGGSDSLLSWSHLQLEESRAMLERTHLRLHGLTSGGIEQGQVIALQPLQQSYSLLLTAADDDLLRTAALNISERLLQRALMIAQALACRDGTPAGQWLSLSGRVYAYSQRTLCLLALDTPLAVELNRPARLAACREHCQQALASLLELSQCNDEITCLLGELEKLHTPPMREPEGLWLHHVSASLLHNLQRLAVLGESLPL